jgi:hypothetical protein
MTVAAPVDFRLAFFCFLQKHPYHPGLAMHFLSPSWSSCHGTSRQFSRKQCFIVPAQTQWTRVQRLSPKNKRVCHLIYPRKQVTEAKSNNPYMVACNSIGYFTPPSATWPSSHLDSLSFISLLYHPLPPATLSGHRLACFFSGPSCYIIPSSLMLGPT